MDIEGVQEKDIPGLIKWWAKVLGLTNWRIHHDIVDETTLPRALMQVTPTRLRHIATIQIRRSTLRLKITEFQKLLCHELCHLLVDPIVEEYTLQLDFTDDEIRRSENKQRFCRVTEKVVEHTALTLCTALIYKDKLIEIEQLLYKQLRGEKTTDIARLLIQLIETSGDAIYAVTLGSKVAAWNPSAAFLYGYSKEEILGEYDGILLPAGTPDPMHNEWLSVIEKGETVSYQALRVCKDSSVVDITFTCFPIQDNDDHIAGIAVLSRKV